MIARFPRFGKPCLENFQPLEEMRRIFQGLENLAAYLFTTLIGVPAWKALMFSTVVAMRRRRAANVAHAM